MNSLFLTTNVLNRYVVKINFLLAAAVFFLKETMPAVMVCVLFMRVCIESVTIRKSQLENIHLENGPFTNRQFENRHLGNGLLENRRLKDEKSSTWP